MTTREDSRYYSKERNPFYWTFFVWNCIDAQLETLSENPTIEEQNEIQIWMLLTLRRTPCSICREHALQLLKDNPMVATSQSAAKEWWSYFHNLVNEKVGKPQLSLDEIEYSNKLIRHTKWSNVWNDLKAQDLDVSNSRLTRTFLFVLIFLFIVIIALLVTFLKTQKECNFASKPDYHSYSQFKFNVL